MKNEDNDSAETKPDILETEVTEVEEKEDFYDKYLRLAADFDNFRKRTLKERGEYLKYANENIVRELLPVVDNFERAIEHGKNTKDTDSIITGIQMVLTQVQSTLERFGVKHKNSAGQPFDPIVHEAVSYVPSEEHEANTVIAEHQKAYFLHDRLIRPALVTVASEKKLQD